MLWVTNSIFTRVGGKMVNALDVKKCVHTDVEFILFRIML